MRLVVLGSSGTHVGRDRRCSGYLVEHDGTRLVLDLGNGALGTLQQVCDVAAVDAVVLSHLHPDHVVDVYSLYYALRFHRDGQRSVPVLAPGGAREHLAQLLGDDSLFGEVCRFRAVAPGDSAGVGGLRLTFSAAAHPVPALATRVEAADGRVVAYTGDSGPTDALVACAADADLLVADASWLERDGPYPPDVHMTGAQAGRLAAVSGARRLLVTHVFPAIDPAEVAAEAAAVYDGEVLVAVDGQEVLL